MQIKHSPYRGQVVTLEFIAGDLELSAEICSIGATVNQFKVNGRELLLSSPLDSPMIDYRGATIAPWPNRIKDAKYIFELNTFQLPINEIERNNALHGLISFAPFEIIDLAINSVRLELKSPPVPGYPFAINYEVLHELTQAGLKTTVLARNVGQTAAPYGVCPHPYLLAGESDPQTWSMDFSPKQVMAVDERLNALTVVDLDIADPWSPAAGKILGNNAYDHAFTGFSEGQVTLKDPSGSYAQILFDPKILPWLQVYTPKNAVALEPMSCPPDAFNSGIDLITLQPEQSHSAWWIISGR